MTDTLTLKIKQVVKETVDAITIIFEQPQERIKYASGQFLTLIAKINGEEVRRAYSLCSASEVDEDLAVTVKRVEGGKMSNYLNDNAKAGDSMEILAPMGNFTFTPSDKQRHIVLIGGGSGITPLLSILKSTLQEEKQSVVSLVYTNRNQESTIFHKSLEDLVNANKDRLRVIHHFTRKIQQVEKKGGFLGLKKKIVEEEVKDRLSNAQLGTYLDQLNIESTDTNIEYYICGPTGMMDIATGTLEKRGVAKEAVHLESFGSTKEESFQSENAEQADGASTVTLVVSGEEYAVTVEGNTTILQAAIEQGVEIPYSCQAGVCTACMGKCTSGSVEMTEDMGLTDQEKADGHILTCVSHPTSSAVTVEYE